MTMSEVVQLLHDADDEKVQVGHASALDTPQQQRSVGVECHLQGMTCASIEWSPALVLVLSTMCVQQTVAPLLLRLDYRWC